MAHPQIAGGGMSLQVQEDSGQPTTGGLPAWRLGGGLTDPHRNCVAYYKMLEGLGQIRQSYSCRRV